MILLVVVCAAGPASDVGTLITLAHAEGWTCRVICTPNAVSFVDIPALERQTGHPVRSAYRAAGTPRTSEAPADAVVVAPATFNTVNKLAAGIADTYASGVLAECVGDVPVVIVPFVNAVLAGRAPFRRAVAALRAEGARVLLADPAHLRGAGAAVEFPWDAALRAVDDAALER
ncbi:flavoprotein [Longispora fulva]|uniref:Phosphopantothenoylcysteine synthetase/decarboxylase n=1 Tax=Longispora fulva TaxID=619741 RepID=A0A8J7KZP8_9ACTN|nr:flavoprotein [Longispora fulva]MBG6141452.1 phosphopantothenoylcysteine synthetase/decarboxylase [Longispora fulva]GIG59398.1 flavoprotein [Longispora fulva]